VRVVVAVKTDMKWVREGEEERYVEEFAGGWGGVVGQEMLAWFGVWTFGVMMDCIYCKNINE
jgi:hypothetical protein